MSRSLTPLRFEPGLEHVPADEAEVQRGLVDAMLAIQAKTRADTGHAHRAVHAKAHGYVRARFEVLGGLAPWHAQGLFATSASYDAVLRFSTTPGDILDDAVSSPRGVALKVIGVPGARLPGSEGDTTQDYVLGNSPSFQVATAAAFLKQLRLLAATTGRAEAAKRVFSAVSRGANAALGMIGASSATLTTLAGQAPAELLGDTFYSQAPLLHGDFYGKVSLAPVSDELVALSGRALELPGHPDAVREGVERHFALQPGTWELRVQLATDRDAMPVEDAAKQWPEADSPYVAVARITADPQPTWTDTLRDAIEERMAFSPWTGLAAHRPLGSIMRARRPAYPAARDYRARENATPIAEPTAA